MSETQSENSNTQVVPVSAFMKLLASFNTRTKLLLGFSVPLTLLALICTVVYFNINKLIETSKWVKHTQQVIGKGEELKKLMIDMETGERGF